MYVCSFLKVKTVYSVVLVFVHEKLGWVHTLDYYLWHYLSVLVPCGLLKEDDDDEAAILTDTDCATLVCIYSTEIIMKPLTVYTWNYIVQSFY